MSRFDLSSFLSGADFRIRFWWPAIGLLAVFSYLYSLDGLHIPHIGDEAPYIEITRLTAEEGHDIHPQYLADGRIIFSSTRIRTYKTGTFSIPPMTPP